MGKRKGSPQIPLALRQKLQSNDGEVIEKRFISSTPGNASSLSRKVLRKRQRDEKKLRKQAFYSHTSVETLKQKKEELKKPPRKKRKTETGAQRVIKEKKPQKQPKIVTAPQKSREDEDISYYEKKLKKFHHQKDQLDGKNETNRRKTKFF